MKKSAQHRLQPLATDQWVQAALTGELISVLRDDWLNLLKIGRLSDSLDQLRIRCRLPERSAYAAAQFDGLLALHCVYYDAMSWTTRAGLPSALLAALGLDAHSGPQLLGPVGWQRLTHAYEMFAQPRQATAAPARDKSNDVSDDREFQHTVASTAHKVGIQEATASALTKLRTAFASLRARLAFTVGGAANRNRIDVARSAPSHAALTELHCDRAAEPEYEGGPPFLSAQIRASEIATTCPECGRRD